MSGNPICVQVKENWGVVVCKFIIIYVRFLGIIITKPWQNGQTLTLVSHGLMPSWHSWGRRGGSIILPDMPWPASSQGATFGCLGRRDLKSLMNFYWMLIGLWMLELGYGSPAHRFSNSFSIVIVRWDSDGKRMLMETSSGILFEIQHCPLKINFQKVLAGTQKLSHKIHPRALDSTRSSSKVSKVHHRAGLP